MKVSFTKPILIGEISSYTYNSKEDIKNQEFLMLFNEGILWEMGAKHFFVCKPTYERLKNFCLGFN